MATAQLIFVKSINDVIDSLIRTIQSTPADKLTWSPDSTGRTIIDIATECAGSSLFMAQAIGGEDAPTMDREKMAKYRAEHNTLETVVPALKDGGVALDKAISSLSDGQFDDTVTLPFRGGITRTKAQVVTMMTGHLNYHLGQINYIQTLYGDKEMH